MQNPIDGMMEGISKELFDEIGEAKKEGVEKILGQFEDGTPVKPDVSTFRVGEKVQVNGGWFRIRKITKKDLVLRGIPYPQKENQ